MGSGWPVSPFPRRSIRPSWGPIRLPALSGPASRSQIAQHAIDGPRLQPGALGELGRGGLSQLEVSSHAEGLGENRSPRCSRAADWPTPAPRASRAATSSGTSRDLTVQPFLVGCHWPPVPENEIPKVHERVAFVAGQLDAQLFSVRSGRTSRAAGQGAALTSPLATGRVAQADAQLRGDWPCSWADAGTDRRSRTSPATWAATAPAMSVRLSSYRSSMRTSRCREKRCARRTSPLQPSSAAVIAACRSP